MWSFNEVPGGVDVVWNGDDPPKCRFCGEQLTANNLKKMKIKGTGREGFAADIECICLDCRCLEIFGVAISEGQFNSLRCMELP
jgi:hypothetical protein